MDLVRRLRLNAEHAAEKRAVTFLNDGEGDVSTLTYREVVAGAARYASELSRRRLEGERAIIALPASTDFILAFVGCLMAGVIPVPLAPLHQRDDRTWSRLAAVVKDCDPAVVISSRDTCASPRRSKDPLLVTPWLAPDDFSAHAIGFQERSTPANVAFLQYTSGSTAEPKGVIVTHKNLAENVEAICTKLRVADDSVAVSWLPMHHDMGLIGVVLTSLFRGIEQVLMSPTHFAQRPVRWLRAIARHRGTHSGGPNFAFDLCCDRIPHEALDGVDLSSWVCAGMGAEPVRAQTIERFTERFARHGFRRSAIYPCYGLAEATLLVAGRDGAIEENAAKFDRVSLASGVATASTGPTAVAIVSCGTTIPGHQLLVVDPETGTTCEDGRIGEIWLRGSSVADGYWKNRTATNDAFRGETASGQGGFLRTGDLGFFFQGELYPAGRLKDVFISYGRKIYPQDVEATALSVPSSARLDAAAAFVNAGQVADQLVVVVEVRSFGEETPESLKHLVVKHVAECVEVRPSEVLLVKPRELPRTTSGKLMRGAARMMWQSGQFHEKIATQSTIVRAWSEH